MIVFPSKEKRQKLDQLLDPFIRKAIKDQIASLSSNHPLVIVDIPLLYEGHYDHYMDAVAVVYTTPDIQLRRLMKRNQLTLEQAQQRISSQLPIEEKKQRADILLDNNGTKEELVEQIENWLSANRFL